MADVDVIGIGDLISLEAETVNPQTGAQRFIGGRMDGSLQAMEEDTIDLGDGFSAHAVFVVQSQSTWTRLQAYKTLLEQTGLDPLEAQIHPETRDAYLESKAEFELHKQEFERAKGRPVRFGMVVQLLSWSDDKFLSTSRKPVAGGNMMLLDENAGESSWFRIMPRLRVHNEGERVRIGDPVILESITNHLRVMVGSNLELLSSDLPAAEHGAQMSFRLNQYRSVEDQDAVGDLVAGSACSFYHKECEAYLRFCSAEGQPSPSMTPGSKEADSHSVWQLQSSDEKDGSTAKWGRTYRLRHASSGKLLAVTEDSRGELAVRMIPVLESHNDPETTLFKFVPQYPLEGVISQSTFMHLFHVQKEAYLSAVRLGAEVDEASPASPRKTEEEKAEDEKKGFTLTARRTRNQTDIFSVRSVKMDVLQDVTYVLNACHPLEEFLKDVKRVAQVAGSAPLPPPTVQVRTNVETPKLPTETPKVPPLKETKEEVDDIETIEPPVLEESNEADGGLETIPDQANEVEVPSPPPSPPPPFGGGTTHPRAGLNSRPAIGVLTDLILFVTVSDNHDPFTREGMPVSRRQKMLCELGILKLAVMCVEAPFESGLYEHNEIDAKNLSDASTDVLELRNLSVLAMRLSRHIVRGRSENKSSALGLVPSLLNLLPCGVGSSDCLTELFTDNDMVDQVPDATIQMFIHLIREKKRHERYIRFLEVLCSCRGKAVRPNQWRIASALLEDAPELLLRIQLSDENKIMISGDARYFPKLKGCILELSTWLETTDSDHAAYFAALISLYAALVRGRNLVVSPTLQRMYSYELLLRCVTDDRLNERHLDVPRQFVRIVRDLYVNNDIYNVQVSPPVIMEPHPKMVVLKSVRKWHNVPPLAEARMLNTRFNLAPEKSPNWSRFDDLKEYVLRLVTKFFKQDGLQIKENKMVLELVMLTYDLILVGFYKSAQLSDIIEPLLRLLDGRADTVGINTLPDGGDRDKAARFKKQATIKCNTVIMMETKRCICDIFQLICTVRVDIRISIFLGMYHAIVGVDGSGYKGRSLEDAVESKNTSFEPIFDLLPIGLPSASKKNALPLLGSKPKLAAPTRKDRIQPSPPRLDTFSSNISGAAANLVPVLLDLTYYEDSQLVSAALGLLVRQHEQRKVLEQAVRKVQLLSLEQMCRMYATFDELLSQLMRLSERRRLFNEELYTAVVLLSHLTMHCYAEEDGTAAGLDAAKGKLNRSDHTAGLYLMLVGKANATLQSATVTITARVDDMPPIIPGSAIHILETRYEVLSIDGGTITLNQPVVLNGASSSAPDGMANGTPAEVWLFLEQRGKTGKANPDMQLLLFNMDAHKIALRFLLLPVSEQPGSSDMPVRQVLLGVYRLLKGMCSSFKVTQLALMPEIDTIVSHIKYKLISHDITPTGCLVAILKDNPTVCMQISDDLLLAAEDRVSSLHADRIRRFVRLAAEAHAPRFIRFLRNITGPENRPILRTQFFVIQGISENLDSQVFFNGEEGQKERDALIAARDHIVNPRGKLAYHIELIGLIARCTEGLAPGPEAIARNLISIAELLQHLNQQSLPLTLRANYLAFFDEAYLIAKRPLVKSPELIALLSMFAMRIEHFLEHTLPKLDSSFDRASAEGELTDYVLFTLTKTLRLFIKKQYDPSATNPDDLVSVTRRVSSAIEQLDANLKASPIKSLVNMDGLELCMEALKEKRLIESAHGSPAANDAEEEGANTASETKKGGTTPRGSGRSTPRGGSDDDSGPWHPQSELAKFVDLYHEMAGAGDSEFSGLTDVFTASLNAEREDDEGGNPLLPPLQNLVGRMQDGIRVGGGGSDGPDAPVDVHLTVACARILRTILEEAEAFGSGELRARQDALNGFGVSAVVIRLISCSTSELYKAGLELGLLMLKGGNPTVQTEFYQLLSNRNESATSALDGTKGRFFERVRDSIRCAVKEIPDAQAHARTQRDAREHFGELTAGLKGATVELLRADMEAPFKTLAHPALLLSFLKEMCEGHYEPMQDLFHEQPFSSVAIDIGSEVSTLLLALESGLDGNNVGQASLAFLALVEMVQGNSSGKNTKTLLDGKLIEMCNRLLTKQRAAAEDETPIKEEDLLDVKVNTLLFTHALLEQDMKWAMHRMKSAIDLSALSVLVSRWYEVGNPKRRQTNAQALTEMQKYQAAGFQAYTLMRKVSDAYPDKAIGYETMSETALSHYDRYVGRVEICNAANEIDRVYFRIPRHALLLAPRTKDDLLWGVDRETPGVAVHEFLIASSELHVEVVWQDILSSYPRFQRVVHREYLIEIASVFLALAQNLLLLIASTFLPLLLRERPENRTGSGGLSNDISWDITRFDPDSYSGRGTLLLGHRVTAEASDIWSYVKDVANILQCMTCGVSVIVYIVRSSFLMALKLTSKGDAIMETINVLHHPMQNPRLAMRFIANLLYALVSDTKFLFGKAIFFLAACLGFVDDNGLGLIWVTVNLFQLLSSNKGLLDVLRAVTQNGKQLLLTFLLLLIFMWVYSVWAYEIERTTHLGTDPWNGECDSLGRCWLWMWHVVMSGGVLGMVGEFKEGESSFGFFNMFLFHATFFIIVSVIMLNVVSGIILDSFAELRGEKAAKKAHMENTCFICGIDRFTFDTKGNGFEEHIRNDHWMWTYFSMIVHVLEKDPTEYNGWETYIAGKIQAKDSSFLPRNTALVLKEAEEADASAARSANESLAAMNDRLDGIEKQNDKLMKLVELLVKDETKKGGGTGSDQRRMLTRMPTTMV